MRDDRRRSFEGVARAARAAVNSNCGGSGGGGVWAVCPQLQRSKVFSKHYCRANWQLSTEDSAWRIICRRPLCLARAHPCLVRPSLLHLR